MNIIFSIVIGIAGYFILMLFSTNLTGMIVRGFFTDTGLQKMKKNEKTHPIIRNEIEKNDYANVFITIISVVLLILFLYLLNKYLTFWALIAAILLIVGRIPDLLREIKTGEKITLKNMRKKPIDYVTITMDWLALPALWWALFISFFR